MRLIFKHLVVIALITTSANLIAQNQASEEKNYINHTLKMYDYEFTGELNSEQMELLRTEVSHMLFVTKAKIFYKSEKGFGQIRLYTDEYFIDRDTNFEFDIYGLKMLITKFNLSPTEYRSEIITK